jgi:hypothetical protein
VVGDPELADDEEADHEAEDLGPQRPHLPRQPVALGQLGLGRERQHQQGDDDGEHRVAEEDQAVEARRALVHGCRRVVHHAPSLAPSRS